MLRIFAGSWFRPIVVISFVLAAAARAGAAPSYPAGEAGRHAAAWFEAYDAGEAAMRAYLSAHVAPAALARRPLDDRLEIYREMREEHGALTPIRVDGGDDASVTVIARAERGPALSIQFRCDPEPPHGLFGLLVQDAASDEVGARASAGREGRSSPDSTRDAGSPADGGDVGPPLTDGEIATALGAALDSLSRAGALSGAALLARDGTTLYRGAFGMADRAAGRPNRPETKFNLGSINKIFTHVAIMQLAEQGKLHLGDTIDRFLPDYPKEKGSKITVAMLLDHRGGTGDIFRPEFREKRLGLKRAADWYAYVRGLPLEFEPGTRRAYSNVGYVLLGAIVESLSGMDYYRYVRERIFATAGMKDTDSYLVGDRVPDRAVGYTRDPDEGPAVRGAGAGREPLHTNSAFLPARGSAAGGGYSTIDDLARFVAALRSGKLLGAEASAKFVGPEGGLGIAGGSPGVNAALEVIGPYTLVVLSNLDPPSAERAASLGRRLLRRAEGAPRAHAAAGGAADGRSPADEEAFRTPRRSDVPPEGIDVPMEMAEHLPAVDVMLNGKGPFRFAIDTGGSGTARVDSALAASLGLNVVGEIMAGDPSGKNQRSMKVVAIDSLAIAGARFAGLQAPIRTYNGPGRLHGVDGVLGFGLFDGYTVTFDYPGARLRLERAALPPADGKRVLDYTDADGIPSIHIAVDSLDMVAHVDAGSMGGFILPERLIGRLPLSSEPVVIGRARTVSNTFEIKGAPLRGILRIGDLEFANPDLEFQPIMPDANVGSRILKQYRVSFDTRNKRIRFARAS